MPAFRALEEKVGGRGGLDGGGGPTNTSAGGKHGDLGAGDLEICVLGISQVSSQHFTSLLVAAHRLFSANPKPF